MGMRPAQAGKCPNIHIILDRSGSMSSPMGTGTRWSVAKSNLAAALDTLDGKAPVGLTIFPNLACDSETPVRPAYFTKPQILTALERKGPDGSTPSGTAVRDVAALAELHDPDRQQYIILITDGGPGCGGEPDTPTGTTSEIRKALMQSPSITTFVIGVGTLSSSEVSALNQMADAGGRPNPGATKYYPATTSAEMSSSLGAVLLRIFMEVGACSDAAPYDMGTSIDLSSGFDDMSMSRDMGMSRDMSGGSSRDMSGESLDLSMDPSDPGNVSDGGSRATPPPVVDWIDPKDMDFGMGGPAEITGRNFVAALPSSQVYFDSGSNLTAVPNVLVMDGFKIKLLVPSDLPVGKYDVVVKNPDGQIGRAVGAFSVLGKASGCSCSIGSYRPFMVPPGLLFVVAGLLSLRLLRRRR